MERQNELTCTYSTVLSKNGRPFVSIMFTRGKDIAEGTVPDCIITKNEGFTQEEVQELEDYLEEHRQEIIDGAKKISNIKHLLS